MKDFLRNATNDKCRQLTIVGFSINTALASASCNKNPPVNSFAIMTFENCVNRFRNDSELVHKFRSTARSLIISKTPTALKSDCYFIALSKAQVVRHAFLSRIKQGLIE